MYSSNHSERLERILAGLGVAAVALIATLGAFLMGGGAQGIS